MLTVEPHSSILSSFEKTTSSSQFIDHLKSAIEGNLIQKFLYAFAYPIAASAKKFGLTSNSLTLFSFIFTLFAFVSLIKNNSYNFMLFWLIAYILDYADGTLARMTNSKGKTALRYDHTWGL